MSRTKIKDRVLPAYTKGEEIANMVTHTVGAVFGLVALVLLIVFAAKNGDPYRIIGVSVYGASLVLLYTVSSVYHGLNISYGKKIMQVIDHCTIYFLIAGTYTPLVLGPIREIHPAIGWVVFALVWAISAFATVFTAIDHNKYKKLSMLCYIGIGWIIIFAVKATIEALTLEGFFWILGGGIAYTVGAALYYIGGKKQLKYVHSVFHVFVLAGTVLQFIAIFKYCAL